MLKLLVTILVFQPLYWALLNASANPIARAGFYMPDSIQAFSLPYTVSENLIVLPVVINDSVRLKLVLDTGCRNLILFGKYFVKYFNIEPEKKINFSGLGAGKPLVGKLSIKNTVRIGSAIGENIPVVIVPKRGVFSRIAETIDGVIGYDVFIKFEIELNPATHRITFRPAMHAAAPGGYTKIPLQIVDSKPMVSSTIVFNDHIQLCNVIIDTGSSLGLLLKTTTPEKFHVKSSPKFVGRGFNGYLPGFDVVVNKVILTGFEIESLSASVTASLWHNDASIGMGILNGYSIILNYAKEYLCLKKL